jgi:hypothetical protein
MQMNTTISSRVAARHAATIQEELSQKEVQRIRIASSVLHNTEQLLQQKYNAVHKGEDHERPALTLSLAARATLIASEAVYVGSHILKYVGEVGPTVHSAQVIARAHTKLADLMSETTRASDLAHRAQTSEDRIGEALEAVYHATKLVEYVQSIMSVADQIRDYQASAAKSGGGL